MADIKIVDLNLGTVLGANDALVLVQGDTTLQVSGQSVAEGVKAIANLADKAYVDAIVAGAPELLDTLNELAAAIGDDPNFGESIRTILDSKLPTDHFGFEFWNALAGVTTYHIAEDTNLYFTNARGRASVFDNRDIIVFQNGGEVGNAQLKHQGSSNKGMDVYSPNTHQWVQLNYDDTNYVWVDGDHVGIDVGLNTWQFNAEGQLVLPYDGDIVNPFGESVLGGSIGQNPTFNSVTITGNVTSPTHAATKDYVDSQINAIGNITSLNDLTNVSISNPTNGQVLKYNGSAWVNGTDATGSGGSSGTDPTFTSVTTGTLSVQTVAFTGTGPVNITSGNDLNLTAAGDIFFNGERTISLTRLKTVVAASTDFADFKARIAAL